MEFAEFSSATVRGSGNRLTVSHGGDENLLVSFYTEPVLQTAESEKQGRPIYKDTPFVWIRFPGDRTREVKRKATQEYRQRFPQQWAAFERQVTYVEQGTPLEQVPWMSRSRALELKAKNIFTLEHYAGVPDSALHEIGHGARAERDKAIATLKVSKDSAETLRLAAENQSLREDVEMLKAQIAELAQKKKPKAKRDETEDE